MRLLLAMLLLGAGHANAALLGRAPLTPGGTDFQAYYDDVLGITWLADADFAASSGYDPDGLMVLPDSLAWIAGLNAARHLGATGWRLPAAGPINGSAYDYRRSHDGSADQGSYLTAPGTVYAGSTANELAHLYYNTLGNRSDCTFTGSFVCSFVGGVSSSGAFRNSGPFNNVRSFYWTSAPEFNGSVLTFYFDTRVFGPPGQTGYASGEQNWNGVDTTLSTWVVTDGDPLAPVPIPAAAWLFASALGGLAWLRRPATRHKARGRAARDFTGLDRTA